MASADLDGLPKTSADVDGNVAYLRMDVSVRWPRSVADVTDELRRHVREQVTSLTGVDVAEVRIRVQDLVTDVAPPPRVQ